MRMWPRYPSLYEINTWVWLTDLSRRCGRPVNLASVPSQEWDAIAALGFDAVWLMGVWERSPAGIAIANATPALLDDFRRALPDFRLDDNVGSPYCVRRYVADQDLGGPGGLAEARRQLAQRGLRLVLDFVPNHVAPDHPWVAEHPDFFVQDGGAIARGRDPFFPAWPDVLQLNAFNPGLRRAVIETITGIAGQSDGIRCDMAMLLLNSVFERTWCEVPGSGRAGPTPPTEYWADVIPAVKQAHSDFLFIAEAYWDMEWELQRQGFDFCYDKRLYDRLEHENAESVRLHLCADPGYQDKLLRFIENHDEPRAAAAFHPAKARAAAVVAATLPGARLFHEGQFDGRKVRLPVFLGRRPEEPADEDLRAFYNKLLTAIDSPVFRGGEWRLCERTGWPDNSSYQNMVAWSWKRDAQRYLIVTNLSGAPAQAMIHVDWNECAGGTCTLKDELSGVTYARSGDALLSSGLYVDLAPWSSHILHYEHPFNARRDRHSALTSHRAFHGASE
jgi:glycosidase